MRINKLVTVVIPVYNAGELLYRSIDSVLKQTYENLEIILVDDGSTDNSLHICREFEAKDSKIRVLHKQNEGVSLARNMGLFNAHGDYIYFMDADDYLYHETISELVKQLEENNLEIVISSYSVVRDGNLTNKIQPNGDLEVLSYEDTIKRIGFDETWGGYLWNKLFTNSVIGSRRFDATIHMREDLVFCYDVIEKNTRVGFYHKCLYHYCIGQNNSTHQGITDRRLSLLYAGEYELCYFRKMLKDEVLVNHIGQRLVCQYYEFLWRIIRSKELKNKKYWLEYIADHLKCYKRVYPAFQSMSWRRKIKAVAVSIYLFCNNHEQKEWGDEVI